MTIDRATEERVREAEYNVNRVWQTWRSEFDTKTSKEVLAMVAYQFAKLYYQLLHNVDQSHHLIDGFEAELDRLLELTADADTDATITTEKA